MTAALSGMVRTRRARPAMAGGTPVRGPGQYLVFGAPQILEDDIAEVVATLRSGWIGTGPRVKRLEADFAAYLGVPHAVALSSCTTSLRLAMTAGGLKPGDEVITTPMTFCATVNSILHCGARPVLVDCDRHTFNIDPERVRRAITPRTRGILPVHFAGRLCDMEALTGIAGERGLFMAEDCAHAIETRDAAGRHAGTFGDVAAFSFYATKNVTTAEGGMVVTRHPGMAERIRTLGLHGISTDAWKRYSASGYRHYDVVELGYKCNMSDLQAALGINQLARVEMNLLRREEVWKRYDEAFADLPLELPALVEGGARHARHLYTVLVDEDGVDLDRDTLLTALHAEGIGVGVHYLPVSHYSYYRRRLKIRPGDFPNAEEIGRRTLSLPLTAALTDRDVDDVIRAVRKILLWHRRSAA